jgi:hypothetical protein
LKFWRFANAFIFCYNFVFEMIGSGRATGWVFSFEGFWGRLPLTVLQLGEVADF